jgi:hypothetical protein
MKRQLALVLILFGWSWLLTQKLTAAEALAVANNGKWALEWTYSASVSEASEKAIAACRAKGGTDPQIVWSTWGSRMQTHWAPIHGSVAVSDNGTGTIVGWSFDHPVHNHMRAKRTA